jgi:hypothetical protein
MTDASGIAETLADIQEKVTRIEETCRPCRKTVDADHKLLHGNGANGMKSDVLVLRNDVDAISERCGGWKPKQIIALVTALTAFAAVCIGGQMITGNAPQPVQVESGE